MRSEANANENKARKFHRFSFKSMKEGSHILAKKILSKYGRPVQIVYIERGGMVIARLLSDALYVRNVAGINASYYLGVNRHASKVNIGYAPKISKKGGYILIVDDIADTGETLRAVSEKVKKISNLKIVTCTIFYKNRSIIRPDVFLKTTEDKMWIVFEYEENEFKAENL